MKSYQNVMTVENLRGQRVLKSFLMPDEESRIEIFAKNIPQNLDEDDIVPFFECVGPLHCLRLMMNHTNEGNRGFAYITYLNSQDAHLAVKYLDGKEITPGNPVKVSISMNNCRIFVGGIPVQKTKDEVWQELVKKGITGLVDVIMYRSYSNRSENRGFVFVEFPTHQYAAKMRNKMMNMNLWNKEIIVDWSVPEPVVGEEEMKKVKILYLRNLPVVETREYLKELIKNYVKSEFVEKVYKFKNYAFIHLASREIALELLFSLKDHYRNTPVEVVFAKPCTEYTKPEFRKKMLTRASDRSTRRPESTHSSWSQPRSLDDFTKDNLMFHHQLSPPTSDMADFEKLSRELNQYLNIDDSNASGSLSEMEHSDAFRSSSLMLNSLLNRVDYSREQDPVGTYRSSSSEPKVVPSSIWNLDEASNPMKISQTERMIPERLPNKAEYLYELPKFKEDAENRQIERLRSNISPFKPDLNNGKNEVPTAEYQYTWPVPTAEYQYTWPTFPYSWGSSRKEPSD